MSRKKEQALAKLEICQNAMSYEESIRVGYQSLFASLEAIFFSLVILLNELGRMSHRSVLVLPGMLLCFGFFIACEFRARNVDFWRTQIIDQARESDMTDAFLRSRYGWVPFGRVGRFSEKLLGHWFERIVIPVTFGLWLWIMTW